MNEINPNQITEELDPEVEFLFQNKYVMKLMSRTAGGVYVSAVVYYLDLADGVNAVEFIEAKRTGDPTKFDDSHWDSSERYGYFLINGKKVHVAHKEIPDSKLLAETYEKYNLSLTAESSQMTPKELKYRWARKFLRRAGYNIEA